MSRYVIIGLGSIGRRHAANLRWLRPDAEFTIVRHRGRADDFCENIGATVVDEVARALDGQVDLAVLATPSANHVDALPALIDRGCPILVEKPMVTTQNDADDLASRIARSTPTMRAAGFNLRYLPSILRMKHHIDSGDLGRPVRASFVAGQWLPDWRPGDDYRSSYSADQRRGGGVEMDLSHEVDLARWFFGDLQVEFAKGGRLSGLGLESNDVATAVLTPVDQAGPIVTVTLDYVSRRRVRAYEVVGELATLRWCIDGELTLSTGNGDTPITADQAEFDVATTYVDMMRAVLDAGEASEIGPVQSLSDGLASTRLAIDMRDRGGDR